MPNYNAYEVLSERDAFRQVVMMLVQQMFADPGWLRPPEDGDWLRSSLKDAARLLHKHGDTERARKIEAILWEPIMYRNIYECRCGTSWIDQHTCQCDDECPNCGAHTSPVDGYRI